MDPARHRVTWDGENVTLTVTEFMILETLAQRPGIVKTRNQLMDAAYQDDIYVDDRTIDSHIKRVRRKFREIDPEFDAIETLYGAGYRFSEELSAARVICAALVGPRLAHAAHPGGQHLRAGAARGRVLLSRQLSQPDRR